MKRCGKCGEIKSIEDFARKEGSQRTFNSYCKSCQRDFSRAHYLANKEKHNKRRYINQRRYLLRNRLFIREYLLGHPCVDCGEADPVVLEFDHVAGEKEWEICHMVRCSYPLARIQAELLKCVVRCANCHRRKTAAQFGWYRYGV